MKIPSEYRITQKTHAIIPSYQINYQSVVMEEEREIYIAQPPLTIIKENCLRYGSSYEGRVAAVRYHLAFFQKTPIPIHPAASIIAFPTRSPKDYDCIWFFFKPIEHIVSNPEQNTMVYFHNKQSIIIPESAYSLRKQYDRSGMCEALFQQWQ